MHGFYRGKAGKTQRISRQDPAWMEYSYAKSCERLKRLLNALVAVYTICLKHYYMKWTGLIKPLIIPFFFPQFLLFLTPICFCTVLLLLLFSLFFLALCSHLTCLVMDMLWPFSSITPPSVYLLLLMFSSHTLHLLIYIFNTSAWSYCISLLSWSAFTGLFPLLLLLLISFILSLIPISRF